MAAAACPPPSAREQYGPMTLRTSPRALLPVLAAALLCAPARAAEADPFVQKASELMDVAEYGKAQRTINRGLAREGLQRQTLLQLYLLEGTCWVSLGQAARARSSYAKLLTMDPSYDLGPRVSPKVRRAFEATREEMLRSGDLESSYAPLHTPLGNLAGGRDAAVSLAFGSAERAADVTRVLLHVRRLGTSDFAAIDARRDEAGVFTARVPAYLLAEEREAYAMEYYLEAFSSSGRRLAGVGSPVLPLSFLVVPSTEYGAGVDGPAGDLPVLPIAIGAGAAAAAVVVAGAVVGAILLLAPRTGSATVTVRQ